MDTNITNTAEQRDVPLSAFIPVTIVGVAECVTILALNLLVIAVFMNKHFKERQTTYFIINLAIVDALVGAVTGPLLYPWDRKFPRKLDQNVWKFYMEVFASGLFPVMSLLILAAISLERVHATFYPLKHRMVKKRVYHIVVAIFWMLTILANVTITVLEKKRIESAEVDTREMARQSYFIVPALVCFISLVVVGTAYSSIFIKLKFGQRPTQQGGSSYRDKKLTVTLFIVTVVSFLTWLPMLIYFLVASATSFENHSFIAIYALRFLTGVNSLVNPILYVFRVKRFRLILNQLLQKITFRKSVQEPGLEGATPSQETPKRIVSNSFPI